MSHHRKPHPPKTSGTKKKHYIGGGAEETNLENLSSGENLAGWADIVLCPEGVIFLRV